MGLSIDRENIIEGLERLSEWLFQQYRVVYDGDAQNYYDAYKTVDDAIALLKEQEKEIKALHLLVERAEECDFGFDQFQDEYERYKDEIKGMKYIDGMIHVAKRTLEDHGVFEEGR